MTVILLDVRNIFPNLIEKTYQSHTHTHFVIKIHTSLSSLETRQRSERPLNNFS